MTTADDNNEYEAAAVDANNLFVEASSDLRRLIGHSMAEEHPEAAATLALTAAVCRLCRILERPAADGKDVE